MSGSGSGIKRCRLLEEGRLSLISLCFISLSVLLEDGKNSTVAEESFGFVYQSTSTSNYGSSAQFVTYVVTTGT